MNFLTASAKFTHLLLILFEIDSYFTGIEQ